MRCLFALAAVLVAVSPLLAQSRVEAVSGKDYPVSPEAGNWLICAASYSGPDAPELARQLVFQIRSKHGIPAYLFNYADEERKKQKEELDRIQAQYPPDTPFRRRTIRVTEHCGVLVGGYKDFDSAAKVLPSVKKWPMPTLQLSSGRLPYDYVSQPGANGQLEQVPVNPFTSAFVTRNPTVPREAKQPVKFDPIWKKLNAEEEYSVLKNPKAWTLVVKEYPGGAVMQSKISTPTKENATWMSKLFAGGGNQGEAVINAQAMQAQELARVLRKFNFQAYVLHTRTSSIVTVGGFDSVDDPKIQATRQQLATLTQTIVANQPSRQDPLGLMVNPLPMEVPKPQ